MAKYEFIVLGQASKAAHDQLVANVKKVADEFKLNVPADLAIRDAINADQRDPASPAVALYFGGNPDLHTELVDDLEASKIPVIPVVPAGHGLTGFVPPTLVDINACFLEPGDPKLQALTSSALECLGLLHRQRRVFLSYRRSDSRDAAVQLHDALSAHGFDVFLDTHDIRPGDPFQEMLWHRLADCDVLLMLDTKDYFSSKWTKQELGRSLARGISVLRVVWPGHAATRFLSLSDTIQLAADDIDAAGRLATAVVDAVAARTEQLRAKSIAARHLSIAGTIHVEISKIGGAFEGIGAHRAMAISLPHGKKLTAFPVVGIPSAEILHDVHAKAEVASADRFPCVVYDHLGIRQAWLDHLQWLDEQIKPVRALKAVDAGWELAVWDSE